ncbi:hypothetical protein ACHAPA_011912 [Fusarium lateritium]
MLPTSEQKLLTISPAIKSLHTLSVENGRFAVHPVWWTSRHLRLLNISFHEDEETLDPAKLHVDRSKRRAETAKRMSSGSKYPFNVSRILVRRESPLEAFGEFEHGFYYNSRLVCSLYYRAFRVANEKSPQTPQPIVGVYRYDAPLQRMKKSCPPFAPAGIENSPCQRLRERKIRDATPEYWCNDPYLLCYLLSLAGLQYRDLVKSKENPQGPRLFLARLLVIYDQDHTNAYVFKADIPSQVVECFDHPTRSIENAEFPTIHYTKVPYEPHSSFSERVLLQLVGSAYASGFDTGLGKKKRKFGTNDQGGRKQKTARA